MSNQAQVPPETAAAVMTKLTALWQTLSDWSQATFGDDSVRGPVGPLKHLRQEAREAINAVGQPEELRKELADCLLILLDVTRRSGSTFAVLLDDSIEKLAVNQQRKWPPLSEIETDAAVSHIRETPEMDADTANRKWLE